MSWRAKDVIEKILEGSINISVDTLCEDLRTDLTSGNKSFLNLVEILEGPLSSPDLSKHIKGLDLLARVLEMLPRELLSATELDLISQFFCGQVKQHHSFISAALKAMFTLVNNLHMSKESLHKITSTLFNHVVWQTQTLSDRKMFYQLLQYIVFNRIEDYTTVSSEFLFNVISSVDGERDPRNLLLLFSFLPSFYLSLPLGPLAEDAFEVVSCYFPIDFHTASTDPAVVTRDDLVVSLTPCLLAVPEFAPFCLTLIEEKLTSSLKSAKNDSYNLLVDGCKVWPPDAVVAHSEVLWSVIRQDTLPPRDTQIADCATRALQALVSCLPPPSHTPLLNALLDSCEGFLSDVQLSLFDPSSRLLLAAMQASTAACEFLSYKLLPGLVSLLQVSPETSKVLVLNKLTSFIQICLQNHLPFNSGADGWGGLHAELHKCSQHGPPEVRQAAYTALTLLASHLSPECRSTLYPCLLTDATALQPGPLRSACMKCLQALALTYEDEVYANIVEGLTQLQGGEGDSRSNQNKFETFCSLAVVERFQPVLEHQFLTLVPQGSAHTAVTISCLRDLVEDVEVQSNKSLLSFMFCHSSILSTLTDLETEGDVLVNCSKIIEILVRLQSSNEQTRVVEPLARRLLQCPDCTRRMVLLEALMVPLWPDVTILTAEEVCELILPVAVKSTSDSLSKEAALRLLSSLLNKSKDDVLLELISERTCTRVQSSIALGYITKALVLRNHPHMERWLNKLVDLLENETLGMIAADGVRLILDDSQVFLSYQNHSLVKLLYRQRLFYLVVPRLVSSAASVPHLKALAYLLQAVPPTVYTPHIQQITPLLVRSLDTDCEGLLCPVLRTLASLLSANHMSLQHQVDTFIPRFLHLANHSQFMQVRIAALQCLANSLKFSPSLILPHKQHVISKLGPCLDDKKRLVRREAAHTRARWYLLGAPAPDT